MKKYIKSSVNIESSFNRALEHMNETECGFITAFRGEYSNNKNNERNKQLISEIRSSGLSYIKAKGGSVENKDTDDERIVTENSFCVINSRFKTDDFVKLMVEWCKEFDQSDVLITFPIPDTPRTTRSKPASIHLVGRYYDKNGNIETEFTGVEINDISEYFTSIYNKRFTFTGSEYIEGIKRDVYGVADSYMARKEFKEKYPDL